MYEIWLMVMMVWELALLNLSWVLPPLAFGVAGWLLALRGPARWGAGLMPAVGVGAVVAVAAFVLLPMLVQSSLSELRYWVDWAALGGAAAGFGAVGALLLWPWLARGRAAV